MFADDPDRLARFEREAQVLASLNHPDIAQIYGVEESTARRAGHGAGRGRDACRPHRARRRFRSPKRCHRAADRRRARSRARAGHHPPRSQAGEHQGRARTARSRCSTSASPRRSTASGPRDATPTRRRSPSRDDPHGRHSRHRGLHGPEQAGQGRRRRADIWAFGASSSRCSPAGGHLPATSAADIRAPSF